MSEMVMIIDLKFVDVSRKRNESSTIYSTMDNNTVYSDFMAALTTDQGRHITSLVSTGFYG